MTSLISLITFTGKGYYFWLVFLLFNLFTVYYCLILFTTYFTVLLFFSQGPCAHVCHNKL